MQIRDQIVSVLEEIIEQLQPLVSALGDDGFEHYSGTLEDVIVEIEALTTRLNNLETRG